MKIILRDHLHNASKQKNSKFLFKKIIFLINISYAGWPAGPQANPYAWRARQISPQILCKVGQPGPLFAG